MSRLLKHRRELADLVRTKDGVFVLFYASWCPFSMGFLPVFEKHAADQDERFCRMTLDGNEDLFDEYGVEVYPTVLYFKAGKVDKRLDGKHLAGLKERQLTELIASCGPGRD
jgi:thiol-disulfide isomerase/thioredoxin